MIAGAMMPTAPSGSRRSAGSTSSPPPTRRTGSASTSSPCRTAAGPSPAAEIAETGVAYLDGEYLPLAQAKISVAAHIVNYGTGIFEGIRAYWNDAHEQLYLFRCREHFERMARSSRLLRVALPGSPDELVAGGARPAGGTLDSAEIFDSGIPAGTWRYRIAGGGAEVRVVRGGAGGVIVVVAGGRPGQRPVASPAGMVAVPELRGRAVAIGVVASGEHHDR